MRVVLRDDVDNLGKKGEVVDVADGYARNFLVPRGLALKASSGSQKQADAMTRNRAARERRDREAAQALAAQFEGRTITIKARAGGERSPVRVGHDERHRRGRAEADRRRDRPPQAPPRRAAQRDRRGRPPGQAPRRRRRNDPRRGRSLELSPRRVQASGVPGSRAPVRENHTGVIFRARHRPGAQGFSEAHLWTAGGIHSLATFKRLSCDRRARPGKAAAGYSLPACQRRFRPEERCVVGRR